MEEHVTKNSLAISRRTFLEWAAASSAAAYLAYGSPDFVSAAFAADVSERVIPTGSTLDCGGKCLNKAHVVDGVITRISTRSNAELNPDMPVMKGCVRGRSYRKFQYHPDRLKYPMKRVGERGGDRFTPISWDEAIELFASRMKEITEKYGPASRFAAFGSATSTGAFDLTRLGKRLFNATGGFVDNYHNPSNGNIIAATPTPTASPTAATAWTPWRIPN